MVTSLLDRVWSQGDAAASDEYVASHYTIFHDPGDPWEGRVLTLQQYRERVIQSRAPFPDQRFDIQHLVSEGEDVAVAWLWKGTHLGEVGGFPPTGRVITMSGMTLYRFEEGLSIGHWQCTDRLGVFGQLRQAAAASRP